MSSESTGGLTAHVVRVFTAADGSAGNPLGIVESSALTRGREQAIAAQLGYSETVFLETLSAGAETGRDSTTGAGSDTPATATIRIFTPAQELPFAGHPTVGTAWWLRERGTPVGVLVVPAGDVPVRSEGDVAWVSGRASWAPDFEWHELPSPAEVDALGPASFETGQHYAYAWIDEGRGLLRSRMFAPRMGIPEDEATGAAAVAVTARLGRDLDIEQGRGSRLSTKLGRGAGDPVVHLGGRVVAEPDVSVNIS